MNLSEKSTHDVRTVRDSVRKNTRAQFTFSIQLILSPNKQCNGVTRCVQEIFTMLTLAAASRLLAVFFPSPRVIFLHLRNFPAPVVSQLTRRHLSRSHPRCSFSFSRESETRIGALRILAALSLTNNATPRFRIFLLSLHFVVPKAISSHQIFIRNVASRRRGWLFGRFPSVARARARVYVQKDVLQPVLEYALRRLRLSTLSTRITANSLSN